MALKWDAKAKEGQAVEEGAIHHAVGEVLRWK